MKRVIAVFIFLFVGQIFIYGQLFRRNQKFKIFTVEMKASDVVGNKRFNDLGIKHFTTVINNLTDDTTTYLWRLGSVRLNVNDYTDGSKSLFNLSTSNHSGGYPLLDLIDFTFYRERGFQILESQDPSLQTNATYQAFKETMCDLSRTIAQKREFLWLDTNRTMREKILSSRYFINEQPITLNQKLTTKVTGEIKVVLKTDLNNLLKIASNLKDTTNGQKADTVAMGAYFDRTINRTIDLRGIYLSAVFQNEYIDRANYIISRMNDNDALAAADDEFNNNLKDYVANSHVALNSAVFAFKFSGGLDKKLFSVDSIKSDLSALFNIGSKQAASLATTANFMFSRHLDETFHNQFSKVWLIMFGTDEILDKINFLNGRKIVKRKTKINLTEKLTRALISI